MHKTLVTRVLVAVRHVITEYTIFIIPSVYFPLISSLLSFAYERFNRQMLTKHLIANIITVSKFTLQFHNPAISAITSNTCSNNGAVSDLLRYPHEY